MIDVDANLYNVGKVSWKLRALWWTIKWLTAGAVILVLSFYIQLGTVLAFRWANDQWEKLKLSLTRVEVIREMQPKETLTLSALLEQVSREQNVPLVALQAVVDQESSGGKHLYNFEPQKFSELEKKSPKTAVKDELRMLASSHGVAHVMGFNAEPSCGIHWSKLYDDYEGLTCGAKILRKAIERNGATKDIGQKLWLAFKAYNGSGEAAENYANQVSARVMKILVSRLGSEL